VNVTPLFTLQVYSSHFIQKTVTNEHSTFECMCVHISQWATRENPKVRQGEATEEYNCYYQLFINQHRLKTIRNRTEQVWACGSKLIYFCLRLCMLNKWGPCALVHTVFLQST